MFWVERMRESEPWSKKGFGVSGPQGFKRAKRAGAGLEFRDR